MKIFQIGFNRCGTRTIARYFRANGLKVVHWDKGRLARSMFENWQLGLPLLRRYPERDVFTDMESAGPDRILEAYKLFPWLAFEHPDAVFILNTRNVDRWIASRFSHGDGFYAGYWRKALSIDSDAKLEKVWRRQWAAHHEAVETFFADGRYRFFRFDIETDGPEAINRHIPELGLDAERYSVAGKTKKPADS